MDLVVSEAQVATRRVAGPGEGAATPTRTIGPATRGSPPLHEAAAATGAARREAAAPPFGGKLLLGLLLLHIHTRFVDVDGLFP